MSSAEGTVTQSAGLGLQQRIEELAVAGLVSCGFGKALVERGEHAE